MEMWIRKTKPYTNFYPPSHQLTNHQQSGPILAKYKSLIESQQKRSQNNEDIKRFLQIVDVRDIKITKPKKEINKNSTLQCFFPVEQTPDQQQIPSEPQQYLIDFEECNNQEKIKEMNHQLLQEIMRRKSWKKAKVQFVHAKNVLKNVAYNLLTQNFAFKLAVAEPNQSIPNQFQRFLKDFYEQQQQNINKTNQKVYNTPHLFGKLEKSIKENKQEEVCNQQIKQENAKRKLNQK